MDSSDCYHAIWFLLKVHSIIQTQIMILFMVAPVTSNLFVEVLENEDGALVEVDLIETIKCHLP